MTMRKVACRIADQVTLAPTNVRPSERDLDYIGSLLDGLPVLEGNRIRAALFGSRWADFKVAATVPRGPVLIDRPPGSSSGSRPPDQRCVQSLMRISAGSSRNFNVFAR